MAEPGVLEKREPPGAELVQRGEKVRAEDTSTSSSSPQRLVTGQAAPFQDLSSLFFPPTHSF